MRKLSMFFCVFLILTVLLVSSFQIPKVKAALVTLDSYSEANFSHYWGINQVHPSTTGTSAGGQSFTTPATEYILDSVEFYLYHVGTPGLCAAYLYAHSGIYGTSSLPTGAPLAISDVLNADNFPTSYGLVKFSFTGANRTALSASTQYCVVFQTVSGQWSGSDYVRFGRDAISPTHGGNGFFHSSGSWGAAGTVDVCFYVYGEELPTAQWNDVSTWSFSLLTREWQTASTYTFSLLTRTWQQGALWNFNALTRTWQNIATWTFNLAVLGWRTIATWTFNLLTRAWLSIAQWLFKVDTLGWHTLATWLFQLFLDPPIPFEVWLAIGLILGFIITLCVALVWFRRD